MVNVMQGCTRCLEKSSFSLSGEKSIDTFLKFAIR